MTKDDADFDTWFSALCGRIEEKAGTSFNDEDSVRGDYDQGRDAFDVADEIAAEYNA